MGNKNKFRILLEAYGIQSGTTRFSKSNPYAQRLSKEIPRSSLRDFLKEIGGYGKCSIKNKQILLNRLKEIREPMWISEDGMNSPTNVIAGTKVTHGDYDQTVKMYRGIEFTARELQAINSFTSATPVVLDSFKVRYEKSDDFGNNTDITVKKMQEHGKFVFIAFIQHRSEEEDVDSEAPPPESNPEDSSVEKAPEEAEKDSIKIIKSIPIDDEDGSEILTNFLLNLYHKIA